MFLVQNILHAPDTPDRPSACRSTDSDDDSCCYPVFPDDFERHARLLIHTFLTTANFHLWVEGDNYFSPDTDLIPLLHLWSLSVEEQFYFIWPAFLVTAYVFINKRKLIFFSILFCALFYLSIWMSIHTHLAAYFLLPARAFELLMGAGLAIFWQVIPNFSQYKNNLLSIVGIGLILSTSFILSKQSQFPGINAFWPCLGTCFLIISGKNKNRSGIINALLSLKPVIFIGLISYSLYLWHWPVFVFITYTGLELTGILRIAAIACIFALAYLSWKYVEIPFRQKYKWSFKQTMQRVMLPSFITLSTIYMVIDGYDGFPDRFNILAEFNKELNFPNKVRSPCFDKYRIGNISECSIGVKKDRLDGLLIGDSFGNHTAAFLDVLAKDANLYIHDSAAGAYPLLARILEDGSYDKPPEYGIERLKYAKQFKNIYIAANWDLYAEPDNINYKAIIDKVGELVNDGINVVIFSNLRATTKSNLHRLKLSKSREQVVFDSKEFNIPYKPRPSSFIVTEMKNRYPSITVIDPNQIMCNEISCKLEIDGSIIYRSEDHINISGAVLLAKKYIQLLGNPLS